MKTGHVNRFYTPGIRCDLRSLIACRWSTKDKTSISPDDAEGTTTRRDTGRTGTL